MRHKHLQPEARTATSDLLLPWQRRYIEDENRFKWLCASAQVGKSFASTLDHCLRRLEFGGLSIMLSAGERQAKELIREKMAQHAEGMGVILGESKFEDTNITQHEAEFPRRAGRANARIIALPANPRTARGYTGDVLLDEFAQHEDDRAIWAALFTRITRGGRLDVCSTFQGTENKFHELGELLSLHTGTVPSLQPVRASEWSGHLVTIETAVAEGLDVNIAQLRAGLNDDEIFAQEYLCIPMRGGNQYIPLDLVKRCESSLATTEFNFRKRAGLFAGWDIARVRNLSVIWLHELLGYVELVTENGTLLLPRLVTCGVIVMRDVPFPDQHAMARRIVPLTERFCIDATGMGGPIAESLQREFPGIVEPVTFTAPVKERLAVEGKRAMEEGRLLLPADSREIRGSFTALKRYLSSGAHMRVDAASSAADHADYAWAAWLGVSAATIGAAYVPASEGGLLGQTVLGNLQSRVF